MTEIPAQNLPGENPGDVQPKRRIADWKDYLDLMKPRVMSLVIFTAVVGYLARRVTIIQSWALSRFLPLPWGQGRQARSTCGMMPILMV
jgi:hypothetical protein